MQVTQLELCTFPPRLRLATVDKRCARNAAAQSSRPSADFRFFLATSGMAACGTRNSLQPRPPNLALPRLSHHPPPTTSHLPLGFNHGPALVWSSKVTCCPGRPSATTCTPPSPCYSAPASIIPAACRVSYDSYPTSAARSIPNRACLCTNARFPRNPLHFILVDY